MKEYLFFKKGRGSQALVTHDCNPSYFGGWNRIVVRGWPRKIVHETPHLQNNHRKVDCRCGPSGGMSDLQAWSPWVQTPVPPKVRGRGGGKGRTTNSQAGLRTGRETEQSVRAEVKSQDRCTDRFQPVCSLWGVWKKFFSRVCNAVGRLEQDKSREMQNVGWAVKKRER
jgi:hypothetical protein